MSEKSQPLVSIVIPCYNHENFVQDCIQGLVNQTYKNIELIIIDDGSKDDSIIKIQEMITKCRNRFIRFEFRHRSNKGLSTTLNEALEWCEGDYWSICSSDDFYHENKVSIQVEYLLSNMKQKFCVTNAYVINDLNEVLTSQTGNYNLGLIHKIIFDDIFTFKIHLPVTGMYETYLIKNIINGFDPNVTAEDYDIYLKIALVTDIGVIDDKLYYYRSPEAIGSERKRMPMRMDVSDSHLLTINKYKNHPLYNDAINMWNYRRFVFFSAYRFSKIYAFKGMIKSFNKFKELNFYKSLIKLIFIWRG
ncbi:glycosyltransferase family 2 protein [Acinetobacter sp. I-MWF]|uniref:glycosyltransferase family 2 protein n=1 Tax=Acinetobacter sp. I-MWF TaxID=2940517 RepID=UPI0021C916C4|nr:glycosyltransferase family 2 protein [Acinetobacter sp. I-MWF]MCT9980720.1 glycosyltransferase family 2 protein [Acinetobacter sp. I-MWF]